MAEALHQTDHDILNTLVANVANMEKAQEKFHIEIKESLKDLKDNYATRLDLVEKGIANAEKVFLAKADQDKINEKLSARIAWLERIAYGGLGIIAAIEFYFRLYK